MPNTHRVVRHASVGFVLSDIAGAVVEFRIAVHHRGLVDDPIVGAGWVLFGPGVIATADRGRGIRHSTAVVGIGADRALAGNVAVRAVGVLDRIRGDERADRAGGILVAGTVVVRQVV